MRDFDKPNTEKKCPNELIILRVKAFLYKLIDIRIIFFTCVVLELLLLFIGLNYLDDTFNGNIPELYIYILTYSAIFLSIIPGIAGIILREFPISYFHKVYDRSAVIISIIYILFWVMVGLTLLVR
jgi:hypothetical protein